MNTRLASLFVVAAGAAAVGATWIAAQSRRAARVMPRKPEDLSRWESEGGAARPEHVPPPVDKA